MALQRIALLFYTAWVPKVTLPHCVINNDLSITSSETSRFIEADMSWKMGNRLRLVREQEAPPEIRLIFAEVKEALGLAYVPIIYQAYASFPRFLQLHWQRFLPVMSNQRFFDLGERLRADAYTRAHNYFDIPDLCARMQDWSFSAGAKEELTEAVEQFYYADPLFLLINAAQLQAFEGPIGVPTPSRPATHPVFEKKPVLVDEDSAPPEVSKIFEEMRRAFGLPMVISDCRALARWPDFLRSYWNVLEALLASPLYQQCQYGEQETAWSLARELPGPFELTVSQMTEAGMEEDDITSVVRLTRAFTPGLSGSVLNISIAKVGLEGGNHPLRSRPDDTSAKPQPESPRAA